MTTTQKIATTGASAAKATSTVTEDAASTAAVDASVAVPAVCFFTCVDVRLLWFYVCDDAENKRQ